MRIHLLSGLTALSFASLSATSVFANEGEDDTPEAPIATLLGSMSEDVRIFEEHVVTLANPFMEGRLPGTQGMEVAKLYMEYWFEQAGVQPAFEKDGERFKSWRQPFPLGSSMELKGQSLGPAGGAPLTAGTDYNAQSMGSSGDVTADVVFVGYSIDNGPDGYSSYAEGDDLKGKIALMFRFEPMDADGKSLWSGRPGWSNRASFNNKIRAASERGAAAVIIVNTPGADDERANTLNPVGRSNRSVACPVFHMSTDAAAAFVKSAGHDLMELRRKADAGPTVVNVGAQMHAMVDLGREPLMAENVGAILRGKGSLAEEYIVIGGHLDHLGMGEFGSRRGGGNLHPGADDNASGAAALLMLADKLKKDYDKMPANANARSIVFIGFSGEESGLNGSRFYVQEPIAPIGDHALMINFDMIGRIKNNRLSVSGVGTAKGMSNWLTHYFESSPLDIVANQGAGGGSDHLPFNSAQVPVLFGIIADFHDDYHTPDDVSWKINRVGGVQTVDLFKKIALAAAILEEDFEWQQQQGRRRRGGQAARAQNTTPPAAATEAAAESGGGAYLGISPADEVATSGVKIGTVTEGAAAQLAGLEAGDIITSWNGEKVADLQALATKISAAKPGQEIKLGFSRGGEAMVKLVKLGSN